MTDEQKDRQRRILALAASQIAWHEGSLERDDLAETDAAWPGLVSEGEDNGAYVRAWVWVSFEGTPLDKQAPDEPLSIDSSDDVLELCVVLVRELAHASTDYGTMVATLQRVIAQAKAIEQQAKDELKQEES